MRKRKRHHDAGGSGFDTPGTVPVTTEQKAWAEVQFQMGAEAMIRAATIERCAQVTKEYIESLLDPKSKTMSHWDQVRGQCENYKGSDLPRLNFESLIETIAENAAANIRALKDKP